MEINKIIQGNNLEILRKCESNFFDSVVTDPPYGLSFMGKKWDYDVPSVELWKEVLRVLKPGGYLLSFAGTRTQHRMACNIEDAGFEIRDMIAWVYGSGFPKSFNIAKALEAKELTGSYNKTAFKNLDGDKSITKIGTWDKRNAEEGFRPNDYTGRETTINHKLHTKIAKEWEGWGTALKPAVEPVSIFTKPLQVEHIFAILIDEIWKNLLALDVVKDLSVIPVKPNEVASSVPESAKINLLERLDNAEYVKNLITSHHRKSKKEKVNTAQESAVPSGAEPYQEKKILTGEEGDQSLMDISTSVQMGDISENTVLSWKNISEELLNQMSTLTTETAIKKTIELKTLRSCLIQSISTNTGSLQKIQPNLEPITVARKPISEKTVAENCLKWGVGGINVDGCRIGTTTRTNAKSKKAVENNEIFKGYGEMKTNIKDYGRFPANLIHDGSDEVVDLFPNDSQRFFYSPKANKSERNMGCEELEEKIMNTTESQSRTWNDRCLTCKKKFVGSDDTICHCPPELKITDKTVYKQKNNHPTVKPIALMRYLCRLVTPKGGVILDPFIGSGTTGIAAKEEGFNFVGIELEPEYIKIAEKRIASLPNKLF